MIGFTLYTATGKRIWRRDFKRHSDAVDIGDMDGDGIPEIALASSNDSYLLDADGRVIWQQDHKHSQHAILGNFLWDQPETKQAAFVDRGQDGSIFVYDREGNEVYAKYNQGWRTIISTVTGWTGIEGQSLLLAYRRLGGPPVLLDSTGEEVAIFPFPPAVNPANGTMLRHFVQHFDVFGDGRAEMIVHNKNAIWIYTNPEEAPSEITVDEKLPKERIYNASFYVTS